MTFAKKVLSFLIIVSFLIIPPSTASAQVAAQLPTGTLVRAQGDFKLYYIEDGRKRYIDSPETFRLQGLQGAIRDIPAQELAGYPDGPAVTKDSSLAFPGQLEVAPDLAPLAAKDLQLVNRNGRTLLLFTTMLWNRGRGPLDLVATTGQPTPDGAFETAQRVVLPNGSVRSKVVGNLFWHGIHNHFHFDDFASYVLEMVPAEGQVQGDSTRSSGLAMPPTVISPPMPGMPGMHEMPSTGPGALPPMSQVLGLSTQTEIRNKSTFCLFETEQIWLDTEGPKNPTKTYTSCGKFRQGISVGWADRYAYTLPDQNFDVTDLPAGVYRLGFVLDPMQQFIETSKGNNSSATFVDLNPQAGTMRVLAAGAPFFTPENNFPDGMLVRSENSPAVYILQGNRKKLLRTKPSSQVFILPQGVLDAIPSLSLIKGVGSQTVYVLNDDGFRRGISSLEVFNSYGLSFGSVTELSQAELARYPETDLVQIGGNNTVYSISTRKSVGTADSLTRQKLNPDSVHIINRTDFDTYMVEVAAADLFVPWDVVFLPGGDMLVPERSGTIRRVGKNPAVITVPAVLSTGEGGLMGVALHPSFAKNDLLYIYHTTGENGQKNRVVRYKLNGNQLTDRTIIIDNIPSAIYHDGGRIAFGPDGMLYVTTGDANTPNLAQNLGSLAGKTLRLTPDGQIPPDNPFGTAVWSYGHRNSQGIAWDDRGRMWETEHGRSGASTGFDELNIIEKGKNYGWPLIQGDETREGMVKPVVNSGPNETWAPAGIAFTNGSLYFGGLLGSSLYQVRFEGDGSFRDFRKHFTGRYGRLRAVVLGPDQSLYVSTSNKDGRGEPRSGDDKILRLYPGLLNSFK